MRIPARANAYAKLNLGLKIVGRRPDGYHDILSIFQTIDLCDVLAFEETTAGRTEVVSSAPALPSGPDNLIHRAVEALRRMTGTDRGVRVTLTKVIPTGAGLGGGSSDAAVTLRVLNEAWGLGISDRGLREAAAGIGADVPFFLRNGTALVSGKGERLRYVTWAAEVFYILIPPPFQVSTAWAYGQVSGRINFALTGQSKYVNFINSIADRPICPRTLFACMENDFEPVVADVRPALNEIREALRTAGAAACCMTGSGSVMFGAFFEASTAHRAAAVLREAGYRALLCRPLVKDVERG